MPVICLNQWKASSTPSLPALVQQAVATAAGGSPSASISPSAGNSIIVEISYLSTDTISVNPKLTGGSAENLTQVPGASATVAGVITDIWYLHNIGASHTACTFSVTLGTRASIKVQEFSGCANSVPVVGTPASAVANATVATSSLDPIMPNNLIIACGAWTADDYSSGPTNGFTRLGTSTGGGAVFMESAYIIQSAATSKSTGWGLTAGINWCTSIVAFPAAVQSSVLVAGAGTSAANGTYTFRGFYDDGDGPKPFYNLVGQPSNPVLSSIKGSGGGGWAITAAGSGDNYYVSSDQPAFPWLASGWTADTGANPAPTVSESL